VKDDDDHDDDHDDNKLYIIASFFFHHPSAYFENGFPVKIPHQVHQKGTLWISLLLKTRRTG